MYSRVEKVVSAHVTGSHPLCMSSEGSGNGTDRQHACGMAFVPRESRRETPSLPACNSLVVHVRLPRVDAPSDSATERRAKSASLDGDRRSKRESDHDDDEGGSKLDAHAQSHSNARVSTGKRKKKSKPTYEMRRDETLALLQEMRVLEARVELLRRAMGLPSREDEVTLEGAKDRHRALQSAHRTQLLALCGMQSSFARHLREQFPYPLKMHIRLGSTTDQRRTQLLALRDEKLQVAKEFLKERLRDVDVTKEFNEDHAWTSPNGDFSISRAEVFHFEGVPSVKRVYDALMFFMVNIEISISEILGQLTVRDDFDKIDPKVSNHRLLSSTNHGITLEFNSVHFAEYYENSKDHGGGEFALHTMDSVDEDELYPYSPSERVRKDITAALSLSSFRRQVSRTYHLAHDSGKMQDELVVVMRRCAYLTIYKPEFPISNAASEDLRTNLAKWGDAMLKTMRDNLHLT